MTTFDEAACLSMNPFEGDFGSPGDRVLKNKIGTARKGGACSMCRQEIVPGERVRLLAAVFDGTLMSYRWCSECCAAMAAIWTDNGEAWEARARLGREPRLQREVMSMPGEHAQAMMDMGVTRAEYLGTLRRDQPITELRRKAEKSARLKGKLWTQEQCDLITAEAVRLLAAFATDDELA